MEPGAGHPPFPFDGGGGDTHDLGGFLDGEAAEEAELDKLGLVGVELLEAIEGFVEFVEGNFGDRGDSNAVFDIQHLGVPSPFLGALVAGVIDKDPAHELSGDTKEVGAALPVDTGLVDQLHVGFVDEGGGLQGVVGPFAAHVVRRNSAKFGVDDREQLIVCAGCALAGIGEELGDFAAGLWGHGV